MPLPPHLFAVPVYLPYLQPALTDAALAAAEAELGVRLPRAYVAALKLQNGGYLRRRSHPRADAPIPLLFGIGPAFPSILGRDWGAVREAMREQGRAKPERLEDLVPFAGDGHVFVCFDYRDGGREAEPRVTELDVETFGRDEVIAPDFATFLAELQDAPGSARIALLSTLDQQGTAAALSEALGVKLEHRGDQDHGYRVDRARLGAAPGSSDWGAWLFLTPNLVPRGFVRGEGREAKALRGRLPGHDYRFPGEEDAAYLLELDDEPRALELVRAALARAPFEHRALVEKRPGRSIPPAR